MFDPENKDQLARLRSAMEWSNKRLKRFREQRVEEMMLFTGFHYGDNGSPVRQPINMIELGVSIFQRQIASHTPQAMVHTPFEELLPTASDLELAINHVIKIINLQDSLNTCGLEALYRMGIMKIGLAVDGNPFEDDTERDPARVFADPILFQNMILDMTATTWLGQSYMGDEFRVPLEWAMENPDYDKKVVRQLPNLTQSDNAGGRNDNSEKGEKLSQGDAAIVDEFKDQLDLQSVYLPHEGIVLTLVADSELPPLRVAKWEGPSHGPYRPLCYGKVQGNLLPTGLIPMWVDLHEITNRLFRKASNQAERQKTLLLVQGHAAADGKAQVDADDGDAIYSENPDGAVEKSTGGANPQTLAMVQWTKQMLGYMGGNWDALGGLAAQTQTVGQDQLLATNASGRVKEMQAVMTEFTTGVIEDIGYWVWEDPVSEYNLQKPIGDTGYSVPALWAPESRQGEFFQYNFSINPYSAKARSPEEQANAMMQFVMQVVPSLAPFMQQMGMSLDLEKTFKLFARYMHLPEINEIITYAQGEAYPKDDEPKMPGQTTRKYVRENRPGMTQQGADRVMSQLLMGAKTQGQEMTNAFGVG